MSEKSVTRSIFCGFADSVARFGEHPALVVNGERLSYRQLSHKVVALASVIDSVKEDSYPLVGLLAHRSVNAYAGVLGILGAGKGYVPLNPKFPPERTRSMLLLSGCRTLVVGSECVSQLPKLLPRLEQSLTVILPDVSDLASISSEFSNHRFVFAGDISQAPPHSFRTDIEGDAIAYLMFTSGSTGVPKGVPIYHRNVQSYVRYVCDHYQVTERDRFSQEFDLTFDLSVHDMFVCWERGACLFCVPEQSAMAPAKFIRDHELTMWFSVPSVIGLLSRLRLLAPKSFPSLRYSLFCGEPLPAASAERWLQAASNSLLENLYGPTETTIAITHYRWDEKRSPEECVNGIVPIGWPFKGQIACIVGENGVELPPGRTGELCLHGSQVTTGYWNDGEKTREQFIHLIEKGEALWYRTGDLVRKDESGCICYLGRTDHQCKIRGYRVELQEIEAVLRKVCNTEQAISIPWPVREGSADGTVAIIAGEQTLDEKRIVSFCSELLPPYMVPSRIYFVEHLPLNANGKIDRPRLLKLIGGMQS
jgi:amino acid adenylation domain-containing protein